MNIDLTGRVTLSETIEQNVAYLAIDKINPDAKINVALERENSNPYTIIPDLTIGVVSESQKKIETLSQMRDKQFSVSCKLIEQNEEPNSETQNVPTLTNTFIDLGINGEIVIDNNDQLKLSLKNMKKMKNASLRVEEGMRVTQHMFVYKSNIWRKSEKEKNVDLANVDYIVFDINQLPETTNIIINNQKVEFDQELLLMIQKELFGSVAYKDEKLTFGSLYSVVLDVKNASSVYLKSDDKLSDYTFYTVKH